MNTLNNFENLWRNTNLQSKIQHVYRYYYINKVLPSLVRQGRTTNCSVSDCSVPVPIGKRSGKCFIHE